MCKLQQAGRECGGHASLDWTTKCFDYAPNTDWPNLADWHESFPHVFLEFEPDATIPLYPRDYFFLENGKQCMGFAYLGGRIILGSLFMRNFDVQFDRLADKVRMVRADCGRPADAGFEAFYFAHSDTRVAGVRSNKTLPGKVAEPQTARPALLLAAIASLAFIAIGVGYSLACRRYEARAAADGFDKAEMVYEL